MVWPGLLIPQSILPLEEKITRYMIIMIMIIILMIIIIILTLICPCLKVRE